MHLSEVRQVVRQARDAGYSQFAIVNTVRNTVERDNGTHARTDDEVLADMLKRIHTMAGDIAEYAACHDLDARVIAVAIDCGLDRYGDEHGSVRVTFDTSDKR